MNRNAVSGLECHLGYWLRAVSNAVSQSFARQVEETGVTVAEWVFMRKLYDFDRLAPKRLAEELGMTKGAITKLADRLIEKKLVKRKSNPEDGRAQTLALEPAGRTLVPKLAVIADRNDVAFFKSLTQSQRDALERLLRKVAADRGLTSAPLD